MRTTIREVSIDVEDPVGDGYAFDDNFHTKPYMPQSPPKRHDNDEDSFDGANVIQMEKDTLKLRRDLQDAIASKKQAENRILALELLVTSLKTPSTNHQHNNHLANNANKHSLSSEFHQPQQHQLQIQINGGDAKPRRSAEQHVSTPVMPQVTGKLMSPNTAKASQVLLSSAIGPVTDL